MDRDLVQFDGLSPEIQESLTQLHRKTREDAIRNLVTGKTPKKVIFKRPIRGGGEVDYVPGWWFIQQANALFNHQWSHTVQDKSIGTNQVWTLDRVTVHLPGMTVIETKPDGTVIETRFDPINISKDQFGSSDIKKYNKPTGTKQTGDVIDIGDDLKASATEGMKKCLTGYGLAADVYGARESVEAAQTSTLYTLGKKKGMDSKAVDKFIKDTTGKTLDELQPLESLSLIAKIREMPNP
jgi:hypothetical protein